MARESAPASYTSLLSKTQIAALCGWGVLILVSAFLSPVIAGCALLGTVLMLYTMIETIHRRRGEMETDAMLGSLRHDQARLAQDVARNSADIEDMKDARIRAAKAAHEPPPRQKTPMPEKKPAMEAPLNKLRAARPMPANEDPFSDGMAMTDAVVRELVEHAVGSERIDVFLQPVMRMPQRKMRFFEMYARIRARAGEYIPAERYMRITNRDTLSDIDNLLLLRCLRILKNTEHLKRAAPFILNVSANTIRNARFMESLLTFVSRNRELSKRLIFEMRQADFDSLNGQVLQILAGLSKLGCSFSLDHVTHDRLDVATLIEYRVRFIKLDARWMIAEARKGESRVAEINRFKRKLEANGIGVIVEKIENEAMMKELMDFDIHFGQGYLFGKPELEGAYRQKLA